MAKTKAAVVEIPPEAEALDYCDNCGKTLARCGVCGSFADESHDDGCDISEGWMRCQVYWHQTRARGYYEEPEGWQDCERCGGEREGD